MNCNDGEISASESDSEPASVESRISDDSGIEDWGEDMTVQTDQEEDILFQHGQHNNEKTNPLKTLEITDKDIPQLEFIGPLLPETQIAETEIVERKDVLADNGIKGVCGLYNLGNTCFMNATLQCLFATKLIYELVLNGDILQNTREPQSVSQLIERFQELGNKVYSGKYSLLYPDQLHTSIGRLHPVFGDYKQHDSQEFLSFLLNTIHDLLNTASHQHKSRKISASHSSALSPKVMFKSDFPENVNGEVPKRLKMDNNAEHHDCGVMETEPDAGVECEDNFTKGEKAWREYICNNKSVIAETMQGQFQSIITCDKCSCISTTHEPFMFLSLPIPHAMEKEIVITWVPSSKVFHLPGMTIPKKYLVVVNKNGCISDIREVFFSMIKKEDRFINPNAFILAEVDNYSLKILDDRTQLSYVSKTKSIYAIEIMTTQNGLIMAGLTDDKTNTTDIAFNDEKTFTTDSDLALSVRNKNINSDFDKTTILNKEGTEGADTFGNNNPIPITGVNTICLNTDIVTSWHPCNICFDEIYDEDLKIHSICGGMLCNNCIENIIKHSEKKSNIQCPTCQQFITIDDYKRLAEPSQNNGEQKKKLRQVLVPIMFRHDSTDLNTSKKHQLFGHPVICSLLSEIEPQVIADLVKQVLLPLNATMLYESITYDIVLTECSGLSCGLCETLSTCSGCRITDHEKLQIKPGCCITIHFYDHLPTVTKTLNLCQIDKSMSSQRNTQTVSLEECLDKFGDTEVLTEDNPWYCPQCKTYQIATKNMTVTRWPDILIIHLKRFYYDSSQSCKITCPVHYPLTDLNVERLTCPDNINDSKTSYDLSSVVCHTGSLFGGHYTAFTKSIFTSQWFYFNDESYKEMEPSEEHQCESYVLFYQRTTSL